MGGKYIILIGDGMADWPIPAIATALRSRPRRNRIWTSWRPTEPSDGPGRTGRDVPGQRRVEPEHPWVRPRRVYTGRSSARGGLHRHLLGPDDVAVRCNLWR